MKQNKSKGMYYFPRKRKSGLILREKIINYFHVFIREKCIVWEKGKKWTMKDKVTRRGFVGSEVVRQRSSKGTTK
jgi:hypothetical protein